MYGFSVDMAGDFGAVESRVVDLLKQEGFGILSEIDVQATLKAKLGVEKRPYKILGACNPPLANRAIDTEPDIGLLLPCNVVIRETEEGAVRVAFMNPEAVLELVGRSEIAELAKDVRARLDRVHDALRGKQ
ncbi:MAG: DUF302 domain-containing protein [Pseudomonadota bacterium]